MVNAQLWGWIAEDDRQVLLEGSALTTSPLS